MLVVSIGDTGDSQSLEHGDDMGDRSRLADKSSATALSISIETLEPGLLNADMLLIDNILFYETLKLIQH